MLTDLLRLLHVLGAMLLVGGGLGIALTMLAAHRTGNPVLIAGIAEIAVTADLIFTVLAVIMQPATGIALAAVVGWSLSEAWIGLSLILFIVAGLFWIPLIIAQMRLQDLAAAAARDQYPLSAEYVRAFRTWLLCSAPLFATALAIVWLMVAKPKVVF